MVKFFVDTWFLVALLDRLDSHALVAERLSARHRGGLVTHDGVLIELLAYFSGHGAAMRAKAARAVRQTALNLTVVPLDRRLFSTALQLYEDRPDKEHSLVDCMSMIVMRQRGITHAITNDHHFQQEGFTVVNA